MIESIVSSASGFSRPGFSTPRHGRNDGNETVRSILLVLFAAALLFAATMVATYHFQIFGQPSAPTHRESKSPLAIDELGRTKSDIEKIHTQLTVEPKPSGYMIGRYSDERGLHTIWFRNTDGAPRAFRVRFDGKVPLLTEEDIHEYLAAYFGTPASSECHRPYAAKKRSCRFNWWLPDNVLLHADAVSESAVQQDGFALTLIAVDTWLDGKRHIGDAIP